MALTLAFILFFKFMLLVIQSRSKKILMFSLPLVLHEFEKERYFGPFDEQEYCSPHAVRGPFQTSPVSLVPKPNTNPLKFRHVNNLSSPLHPRSFPSGVITSINHSIDADNYPCTWGTFAVVALLIARLPPGSQGAVRDVSEAYRCIPVAPNQWPGTVLRLTDSLFAINVALLFGLTSSGGIWGLIADRTLHNSSRIWHHSTGEMG